MKINFRQRLEGLEERLRHLWHSRLGVAGLVMVSTLGITGVLHERALDKVKTEARREYKMKGCINALMEMRFYEKYSPDQYSTGTSSRDNSGVTYVSTYRDMNVAFMSGNTTSESPTLILLSEEGSALRKKLVEDFEDRSRNNISLPCDENIVPNSFAPK